MRKITYALVALCLACTQTEQKQEQPAEPASPASVSSAPHAQPQPDGFLEPTWFTVPRLDTFRIVYRTGEDGGFDLGTSKLLKLTPAQEQRYLRRRPRRAAEQQAPYYFYSLQENTPARQEITVLHDDGEYLFQLLRLVYDTNHRLISQQEVAHLAADGGELLESFGLFETPARFRLTAVRAAAGAEDSLAVTTEIDSTVTHYSVTNDKFRQTSQRKYHRVTTGPLQE